MQHKVEIMAQDEGDAEQQGRQGDVEDDEEDDDDDDDVDESNEVNHSSKVFLTPCVGNDQFGH